jgi:hypothetical protein
MVQLHVGARSDSGYLNEISTHVRHADLKATQLITSFQEVLGVVMKNSTFNACATGATVPKAVLTV